MKYTITLMTRRNSQLDEYVVFRMESDLPVVEDGVTKPPPEVRYKAEMLFKGHFPGVKKILTIKTDKETLYHYPSWQEGSPYPSEDNDTSWLGGGGL